MRAYSRFLCAVIVVATGACNGDGEVTADQANQVAAVDTIRLAQEWFPNANYAGALMANEVFASANRIHLDILPGSDQVDAIKLLVSGQTDFADVGADRVLDANARNADLVVVGVVNAISPVVFVVKESSGISSPQDFVGKRVGILPGTPTETVYRLMMQRARVDRQKVREMEVPFELATFISGEYDVRPAFAYDEPVTLEREHIAIRPLIEPSRFGVEFLGTVYVTTRKYIDANPDRTRRFVVAVADGWRYALRHQDFAIASLHRYDPKSDSARELIALRKAEPFLSGEGGKVLFASRERWQRMVEQLREIKAPVPVHWEQGIEMKFVEDYHFHLKEN